MDIISRKIFQMAQEEVEEYEEVFVHRLVRILTIHGEKVEVELKTGEVILVNNKESYNYSARNS